MKKAIIAKNINKKYKLYSTTKERLLDLVTPKSYGENFYALTDVEFEAEKGDIIGFVGMNGSGKSTLSNIIAGIVPQTSGTIEINGNVSLIAVSSGLKNDLTGRDNIELKLLMLGFNKEEIKKLEPDVIEFSELGRFIDQPVKSYSSGMKSRLGFAISVNVNPDILIIDEALSVGDKAFAKKSLNKMKEFKKQGKTMIFVSHSIGQMREFCEKILWLEYGTVKEFGPTEEVMDKYELFLKRWNKMSKKEREAYRDFELEVNPNNEEENIFEETLQQKIDRNHPFHANLYIEESISRIGQIKDGKSFIYTDLGSESEKKSSQDFKKSVYYIKKQAKLKNNLFYLLSSEPSAQNGVVGWMNASDLNTHSYVLIDEDRKVLILKGSGEGYSHPWGAEKNYLLSLKKYKDFKVNIIQTVKVGKNLWFYCELNNEKVWVRHNHFLEVKY